MTEILLNTIDAVRSGSWDLLLECIREMLPYCFAYDHINYARYLTYFLGDMSQLNKSFPEITRRPSLEISRHNCQVISYLVA